MEFKFGDIFYIDFPYEDDCYEFKKRPAIFIKKHNSNEAIALVLKVTSELKHLGKDKYKLDFLITK